MTNRRTSPPEPRSLFSWRCPNCSRDNRTVAPTSPSPVALRCGSCNRWLGLRELRALRPEVFAPMYADGRIHGGYVGAVKEEPTKDPLEPMRFIPRSVYLRGTGE